MSRGEIHCEGEMEQVQDRAQQRVFVNLWDKQKQSIS